MYTVYTYRSFKEHTTGSKYYSHLMKCREWNHCHLYNKQASHTYKQRLFNYMYIVYKYKERKKHAVELESDRKIVEKYRFL